MDGTVTSLRDFTEVSGKLPQSPSRSGQATWGYHVCFWNFMNDITYFPNLCAEITSH